MRTRTLLAGLGLLTLSSCDTDILDDPSFDIWCGDTLCSWEVLAGDVEKVSTWHSADYGVSLVGEEVILSQRVEATHDDIQCIEFRLLASVDDDAALSLTLDFLDDGITEYDHPLISDDFELGSYLITPPSWFTSVRFTIHKTGEGEAILGQIRALAAAAEDCLSEPLVLNDRPDGVPCESDEQCSGGFCPEVTLLSSDESFTLASCSSCEASTDCEGACGVSAGAAEDLSFLTCEAPGSALIGEHCASNEECASGTCTDGQCSTCATDSDCSDGETCSGDGLAPHRCIGQPAASGEACAVDADCDSGVCQGTEVRVCDPDGRACEADADCPWFELGATCQIAAITDGTCL